LKIHKTVLTAARKFIFNLKKGFYLLIWSIFRAFMLIFKTREKDTTEQDVNLRCTMHKADENRTKNKIC
jgi:hypothetical protein